MVGISNPTVSFPGLKIKKMKKIDHDQKGEDLHGARKALCKDLDKAGYRWYMHERADRITVCSLDIHHVTERLAEDMTD